MVTLQDNSSYVKFVHAALGYPAPSTFANAVQRGYITGPNQYPRLTMRMLRKHWPNELATARGHLDRTPSAQPHAHSEAVSARRRHQHNVETRHNAASRRTKEDKQRCWSHQHGSPMPDIQPFSIQDVPLSTTLHLDYTGPLPEACTSGTRHFQVSCWGGFINIIPLISLRGMHTAPALQQAVEFFREKGINIDTLRMDNQHSPPLANMV